VQGVVSVQSLEIESNSLFWKILEASHCESIFYRDPSISISRKPLRMSILRETTKKMLIRSFAARRTPTSGAPPRTTHSGRLSLDRLISI